jgi:DNA repair exonuclease SbcCD ATPase subunit
MRIIRLQASNIKRLRAVDITPSGDLVVLSGRNGQGKSSVLDAIWLALGGKDAQKATGTARPVRDGASQAEVTLDLGDLIVTRSWTAGGSYLRVSAKDGRRYNSPQAALDDLVGRLSFDPLAFLRMNGREQIQTLLDLLRLPIDVPALDAKRQRLYDQRTEVGRERDRLKGQLAGMPEPPADLPRDEISAADLMREMQAAANTRAANEQVLRDLQRSSEIIDALDRDIADLEARLARARSDRAVAQTNLDALVERAASIVDPDTTDLQARIASVEQTNAAIRSAASRRYTESLHKSYVEKYESLTREITEIDASKERAIREADLPIAGLGFTADGVTYNGVPLSQSSHAEQLRVSLAMAMALNPKLRVIRITDGSLLDADNLRLIAEMARDNDFQVWVERVDDQSGISIHIEDGAVVPHEPAATADR